MSPPRDRSNRSSGDVRPRPDRSLRAPLTSRVRALLRSGRPGSRRTRSLRRVLAVALLLTAGALAVVRPAGALGRPVLLAARDLPVGTVLAAADLRAGTAPDPPDGALPDAAAVLGRPVTSAVRRGEVLTDARVVAPTGPAAGTGRVATPVRLADQDAVRLLSTGMHVRLLRTDEQGAAALLTTDAVVLTVPPPAGGGVGADTRLLVVFAVRQQDADRVALAAVEGQVVFRFA